MKKASGIVEAAAKLPPDIRHRIVNRILDTLEEPPEDPEEVKKAWQAEIARRIEAVENGTMKTYTIEETMEYLRAISEEHQPDAPAFAPSAPPANQY